MSWTWKLKFKVLNINYIYFSMKVSNSYIKQGYRRILEYHMKELWKNDTDI
jgi:hypothetical protein